jgi:hypothetical protein
MMYIAHISKRPEPMNIILSPVIADQSKNAPAAIVLGTRPVQPLSHDRLSARFARSADLVDQARPQSTTVPDAGTT